jgi:chromosomal replication initiation ATPase DnaA
LIIQVVCTTLRRREKEPQEKRVSVDEIMGVVREKTGIGEKKIRSRSQVRKVVKARAVYCYLAREKSGLSGAELMKQLKVTSGAISSLVSRGKGYFESVSLKL